MPHTLIPSLDTDTVSQELRRMRRLRPLVHCMTNDVVQEMTANVLLAAGASPAMIVCEEEVMDFVPVVSSVLINVGTLSQEFLNSMKTAAKLATRLGKPWVLDPVAAGIMPWRDAGLSDLLALHPTDVRGNASEIRALAGIGSGGKGVDSQDSSDSALEAAKTLATRWETTVCVTGRSDFVTDGTRTLRITGGNEMATLVVGTGCSLSALVAAFIAQSDDSLKATASACALAKKAAELAWKRYQTPGSFKTAYIDALFELQPESFS